MTPEPSFAALVPTGARRDFFDYVRARGDGLLLPPSAAISYGSTQLRFAQCLVLGSPKQFDQLGERRSVDRLRVQRRAGAEPATLRQFCPCTPRAQCPRQIDGCSLVGEH